MNPRPPRSRIHPHRPVLIPIAFGVLSVVLLLAPGPVWGQVLPSPEESGFAYVAATNTVSTRLSIVPSHQVGRAGSLFWGVDLSPTQYMGSTKTNQLSPTNIHYIRWPSGKLNDQYDLVTNVMYADDGTGSPGLTDGASFVSWCQSVGCHAILGVPGEINDPTLAAAEVTFVEQTLHFHPAYWEIGNEPALWTHYGLPWSQWRSGQDSTIGPEGYAKLVERYVAAIHAVDPTAKIIGLPGTGMGAYKEYTWVYDTVHLNGHHLAAVAIHAYPAGHLNGKNGTLGEFDQTLSEKGSLKVRLPHDRAAIRNACPTCTIDLFVTEYNAASVGAITDTGTYSSFMRGFDEVPYLAAEVAQAMRHNARNIDLFDLQGSYPGAMINQYETPRPLYYLYTDMLKRMDSKVVATSVTGSLGEFFLAASTAGSTSMTLLLANANPSEAVHFTLSGSGFLVNERGTAWTFASGMSHPSSRSWTAGSIPLDWTIAPESVVLVKVV